MRATWRRKVLRPNPRLFSLLFSRARARVAMVASMWIAQGGEQSVPPRGAAAIADGGGPEPVRNRVLVVLRAPTRQIYWVALLLVAAVLVVTATLSYHAVDRELTNAAMSRRVAVAQLAAATLSATFDRLVDVTVSLATRVRFRELVAEVSPVYERTALPKINVFAVATPIRRNDGNIAAILVLQVRAESFLEWARGIDVGPDGFMTFKSVEILLVEDNSTDAELTMHALRRNKLANNVTWVKDGVEALDFIYCRGSHAGRRNDHPRLILLDLKLPKVDGIEVLRQLKSDERTKTIPVVVLTSSAEERDMVESYKLGVNSYIVKPVDFEQFGETVGKAGLYWMLMNQVPE